MFRQLTSVKTGNNMEQSGNKARGGWRARGHRVQLTRDSPQQVKGTQRLKEIPIREKWSNESNASRRMEHMASISRSSGLENDGDTLKDFRIQEEYRQFIQEKLNSFFPKHPPELDESGPERKQRQEVQENILILFRKLREGVSSSKRTDAFALEVYETSLFLSGIFKNSRQTTAVISHLIPDLYLSTTAVRDHLPLSLLVSLVYYLETTYPSQKLFHLHLTTIPISWLPLASDERHWIVSVASSLRSRNYTEFERLTKQSSIPQLSQDKDLALIGLSALSLSPHSGRYLGEKTLLVLIDSLRSKARETFWNIVRSAYRELACGGSDEGTKNWLTRSLCLESVVAGHLNQRPDQWLEHHSTLGHTKRKDGSTGRWIISKVRSEPV